MWPAFTLGALMLAASLLRIGTALPSWLDPALWRALVVLCALALAGLTAWGLWRLLRHLPSTDEALATLDSALPGRPIAALRDQQAIGADDAASQALWQAHQARMLERSKAASPPPPAPHLAKRDPYGLRLMALLALVAALIFGPPPPRPEAASPLAGGQTGAGATWEGWISPPAYSGLPNLYLSDQPAGEIRLLKDSRITLRFYGAGLSLSQDLGDLEATTAAQPPAPDGPEIHQLTVTRAGDLAIRGAEEARWQVTLIPDAPPEIALTGDLQVEASGEMAQDYTASDDVAVTALMAEVELDLPAVTRRYGLAIDPLPRDPLSVSLPLPFAGSRSAFTGRMVEDFSRHPYANLPVTLRLIARDGAGQEGASDPLSLRLPGKRFFQPVARAVIEQRRDILWHPANLPRALDLLRAVAHRPEDLGVPQATYAQLRAAIDLLVPLAERMADPAARLTAEEEEALSEALWALALQLEEGDLEDARARLARAQERLNEAMRNGASPEEIAELMDELRAATEAYLDLLAQSAEAPDSDIDQPDRGEGENREVTQDQIQALMDEIQRLMEEGRMEEAQQLMAQLDELLRNLQMQQAEGQGNGPRRPGQETMEELQDTLREQQELADEAFRELQDQFNGRSPQDRQGGQDGQQPQQGQGQGQDQQGGTRPEGQEGAGAPEGGAPQDGTGPDNNGPDAGGADGEQDGGQDGTEGQSLAERQEGLRREIERQRAQLPGLTGEAAGRARDALGAAEEAMDRAEEALRQGDLPSAIDNQAQALGALREGLRALDEAFAANDPDADEMIGAGTEGQGEGGRAPERGDPLGRQNGESGRAGSPDAMLDGLDPRQRANDILEELRRRAGERGRDESELDYLRRLLDQF